MNWIWNMTGPAGEDAASLAEREALEGTWMRPDGPFVRRGERPRGQQEAPASARKSEFPGLLSKLLEPEDYQAWCDALDFRRSKEDR